MSGSNSVGGLVRKTNVDYFHVCEWIHRVLYPEGDEDCEWDASTIERVAEVLRTACGDPVKKPKTTD